MKDLKAIEAFVFATISFCLLFSIVIDSSYESSFSITTVAI